MNLTRRSAIAVLVIFAVPAAVTLLYVALREQLPAQTYDTFSWGPGSEKGPSGDWIGAMIPVYLFGVIASVLVLTRGGSRDRRTVVVGLAWSAAMISCWWARSILMGLVAPDVTPELWHQLLACLPAIPILFALRRLLFVPAGTTPPLPESRFTFESDVRVVWSGSAFARRRCAAITAGVVAGLVLAVWLPPYGILIVLFSLLSYRSIGARVLINGGGIRITSWPVVRPRHDIRLGRVMAARSGTFDAAAHEGRYDATLADELDPRSLLIRDGVQLVLTLDNALPIAVSVDGAEEAADVINALVARERARTTLASDARHP